MLKLKDKRNLTDLCLKPSMSTSQELGPDISA